MSACKVSDASFILLSRAVEGGLYYMLQKEGLIMQLGRVIDADGHILEPPNLWKENLEAKFKDRALGIARDEEGWESLLVMGVSRPSYVD